METKHEEMAIKFLNLLRSQGKFTDANYTYFMGINSAVKFAALAYAEVYKLDLNWFMGMCGWEVSPGSNSWTLQQWAWEIMESKNV